MSLPLHRWLGSCFDKRNQRLTDKGTDILLVLAVFSSWFLYPVMLKFLAYTEFQIGFFIISIAVLVMLLRYSVLNQLEWLAWHKYFLFFWSIYLLFLLSASIYSGNFYSLKQFCVTVYKFFSFFVLLYYMKRNFIEWSCRFYSNFMVIIVVLACMVAVGIALGVVHHIQYFTDKVTEYQQYFHVYWGAYYYDGLRRMQGFCEEPGTFALTILPALFWLLIVERGFFHSLIIAIGVLASYSFGALIAIMLLLPLLWKQQFFSRNMMRFLISTVIFLALLKYYSAIALLFSGHFETVLDRLNLFMDIRGRPQSVLSVYEYLSIHPFGTGSALGMITVNYPISVGYANAMLESGVVGGIAYLLMFGLLGWQALKVSLSADTNKSEERIMFVVAISVLIVLFMGLQRQQPDCSLWHMWIYACFFYLTMQKKEPNTEPEGVEEQRH